MQHASYSKHLHKFLRIIFHLKPRDSVRNLMKENNLPSVNQIYHFEIAKLMQKHALDTVPSPIGDIFDSQSRTSAVQTRSNIFINPGQSRTLKCEQSIRCTAPKVWNSLPNDLKFRTNSNSSHEPLQFSVFRRKMKYHVISNTDFI